MIVATLKQEVVTELEYIPGEHQLLILKHSNFNAGKESHFIVSEIVHHCDEGIGHTVEVKLQRTKKRWK